MKNLTILPLLLLIFTHAHAKKLHLIHTNDLHSYFKGYADGKGGYARVKTKIDELKKHYEGLGIESLHLDGGDFGEGTSYFLAGNGVPAIQALGMMGVEAAVIGNHDYMMGGPELSHQIKAANIETKFLSANMVTTPEMELDGVVFPTADFVKNGIKITVIGLSTAEPHFQYPINPGYFLPAQKVGEEQAEMAKKNGADLVIALTHLGVKQDEKIAKHTKYIDMVVGGHSHTRLDQPIMKKSKANKDVPVLQAHSHGLVVGSMLLDLKSDGKIEVLSYKLHDISDEISENADMKNLVDEADQARDAMFDGRWDEVIGHSNVPLAGYRNGNSVPEKSCWGEHLARMTMQSAGADIGVHLANFEGVYYEPGPVTFGMLVDNFPHVREHGDMGWEIAKFRVKGKVLSTILRAVINLEKQMGINFYGMDYTAIRIPLKTDDKPWNEIVIPLCIKVQGEKIEKEKFYTVAWPYEIAHAVKVLLPNNVQQIFPGLERTGKFYWTEMESYVRENTPVQCLEKYY